MVSTKSLDEFPGYVVDKAGNVYNESNGLRRKPSRTRDGQLKIALYKDGHPHTRSLALLVATAWVYNDFDPDVFTTPIHLNNDPADNHADNLAWRPRWFAVKYQRQYWNEEFRYAKTRVQDKKTGIIYDSLLEVCQKFGYLYMDVLRSCTRGDPVFPTWKEFRFVD